MSIIEFAVKNLPRRQTHPAPHAKAASPEDYQYLRARTVQLSTLANLLILVLTGFVGGFVLLSYSSPVDPQIRTHLGCQVRVLLTGLWILACLSVAYIMRNQIQIEKIKEDLFQKRLHLHNREQYIQELDKLLEACRTIHGERDTEKILQGILETTIRAFHLDQCSILLSDQSSNRFRVYSLKSLTPGKPENTPSRTEGEDLDEALSGKGGFLFSKPLQDLVENPSLDGDAPAPSAISVPLFLRNELIGVLNADKRRSGNKFDAGQLKLLYIFASQISISLENVRLHQNLKEKLLNAVSTLAMALEAKDAYTRGHSQRVSHYSVEIARAMGLDEEEVEAIRLAGILHDIGKIGIRDEILQKRGKLTEEDWNQIRKHPEISVTILSRIPDLKGIVKIVRHHHERYDGTGYPDGLAGEEIPLGARILAVTDMLDALISDRPYREKITFAEAVEKIREASGTQLDPKIVEALEKIADRLSLDPTDILVAAVA